MTDHDRELGTIVTRLTEIERRLAEGDKDMRELTRTVTELVKAMAGLTARLSTAIPVRPPIASMIANTPKMPAFRIFTRSGTLAKRQTPR